MPLRPRILVAALAAMLGLAAAHAAAPDADPEPAVGAPGSITPHYPPVPAEPLVDGTPLQVILNSAAYLERLVTHLVGYETWIGICADAAPLARKRTWVVTEAVGLPGAEVIESLEWMEIIELEGCGKTYERIVYATHAAGKPVFHVRLPGNSRAEPIIQHAAITALRERESETSWRHGCQHADHARIIAGEVDETWQPAVEGAWREVWAVHTCNGVKHVPVLFQPGEDGGVSFVFEDG